MDCRKSPLHIAGAVFTMTVIMFAGGCTFLGIFRYIFDLEDDKYLSRDHLILGGNVLQVAALGCVLILLSNAPKGPLQLGLILSMFILLILVLYLTNFDAKNVAAEWAALIFLIIDMYVKVFSVFYGFGVCSMEEVTPAISEMAKTLGGRKKWY